ncbi:hypothetical protein GQ600_26735 [Phytophthora cactorum]|nr:hypothetical protein GQ600_26735 [Phytophthora cactorum]
MLDGCFFDSKHYISVYGCSKVMGKRRRSPCNGASCGWPVCDHSAASHWLFYVKC